MCFTTPQIKNFAVNCAKDYLLSGRDWTYFRFLFKVRDEFFVADMRIPVDGDCSVRIRRLSYDGICYANNHHRIVIPKLVL